MHGVHMYKTMYLQSLDVKTALNVANKVLPSASEHYQLYFLMKKCNCNCNLIPITRFKK